LLKKLKSGLKRSMFNRFSTTATRVFASSHLTIAWMRTTLSGNKFMSSR
jgi:hypothetical protein